MPTPSVRRLRAGTTYHVVPALLILSGLAGCDVFGGSQTVLSESGEGFGSAIDVHGSYLAVSSPFSGEVFVYDISTSDYRPVRSYKRPSDTGTDHLFGFDLALTATHLAVGSPVFGVARQSTPGLVHLYALEITDRVPALTLRSTPPAARRTFGHSVSASDSRFGLIASAAVNQSGGTLIDSARTIVYDEATGFSLPSYVVSETEYDALGLDSASQYGEDILLDASFLLVGAPGYDGSTEDSGAIYSYDAATGQALAIIDIPTPQGSSKGFGYRLSRHSDLLVTTSQFGRSAFVLRQRGSGDWTLEAELPPDENGLDMLYGASIHTDGSTVVVGAPAYDRSAGAVYVWSRTGGSWRLLQILTNPQRGKPSSFGKSLYLDGDRLFVGAPSADNGRGRVYIFTNTEAGWTL